MTTLLDVKSLIVDFSTPDGVIRAVNDLSFTLQKGQSLGIVGESGSGKSQSLLALMGLLANNGKAEGNIRFKGKEILSLSEAELNMIRGVHIAMIFQDPMTSLNPYLRISRQMTEVLTWHQGLDYKSALSESVALLEAVRIPDAKNRIHHYPHEFSGGMRQRVMIAMALLCQPDLLIADEPTTALDVTIQAEIIQLLQELGRERNTAIILVTHDLSIVANFCDKIIVMYGGRQLESGHTQAIFQQPRHPYTQALLATLPRLDGPLSRRLPSISGTPPDLLQPPPGCIFHPRCRYVEDICRTTPPVFETVGKDSGKACHFDTVSSA